MKANSRLLRWTAQISLLVILLALSAYLVLKPYLGNEEGIWNAGAVTKVVGRGPVTIGNIRWKLDSLQPYTRLVDTEKKQVELKEPAGSVVILVKASITPLDGLRIDNKGFPCEAALRDDRGNVWKSQSAFGLALPTYCGDSDHPFQRNRAGQLAQVYVVPKSAVPHLVGITVENRNDFSRVLLTW